MTRRARPKMAAYRLLVIRAGLSFWLLATVSALDAAEFRVRSAADIRAAMDSARPGDSLIMRNGVWHSQDIEFSGFGASGRPITLRAQTPGRVSLSGHSKIEISGDWLVVDGLRFEGGALNRGEHVISFNGRLGEATNSRLTNSTIRRYNPPSPDTSYSWVSLYGRNNRVDHNLFAGQNHAGVTVVVWRDTDEPDFHRIDANHFVDRAAGDGNGFETIRIGTSHHALSDSVTVVESNLFERIDGEIEIISSKSGRNVFRYNTFRECAGTLTLRRGHDNVVVGNFFLGMGKRGSGGVRVIGERHLLVNNYFSDLGGRAGGAISISVGVPDAEPGAYLQVKDVVIAHNTIVGVAGTAINFDEGLGRRGPGLPAQRLTIANNLIWSTPDPLFDDRAGADWKWVGNIAFGDSLGPIAGSPGITFIDPRMELAADGLYRPSTASPAIDRGATGYGALASEDMDGQSRDALPDVGADELSHASIVRRPLRAADVGPTWLTPAMPATGPPIGGPGGEEAIDRASR